jgi:hypothetical protein
MLIQNNFKHKSHLTVMQLLQEDSSSYHGVKQVAQLNICNKETSK